MSFEKELAAANATLGITEAALKESHSLEKQSQVLIQAMQSTQRNLMETFAQFQSALKKLAEEMAGLK